MLWSVLNVSIRNVTRNARRSLITALAVLIGCGFIIFARGVLNGFHAGMVAGVTETQAGDIQLHRPEYLEANQAMPLDKAFKVDDRFKTMMARLPGLNAYTARIQFSGMISSGDNTTLFFGQAVDPDNEYKVCPRNKANLIEGGPVTTGEANGVVIGKALAESLKVKIGDELTLLVNTRAGALNGRDVKVVGIAEFRVPGIGNKIVHIPLTTAQTLLGMDDDVTEVIADATTIEDVDLAAAELKNLLAGEYKDLNLTPNTWQEIDLGKFILGAIQLQNQVLLYIIGVLFLVMISGIVNTMLMSVFERVREIGTMMAIGVRRSRILLMFLMEAVALSTLGAVLGVGLGTAIINVLGKTGMPLPSIGGSSAAIIFPYIQGSYMMLVMGVAIGVAVLAALYPAFRASNMRPADALRTL